MDRILSLRTASLTVDFAGRFLLITWHGRVAFEDYKKVLITAAEIVEIHDITNVIINRLDLLELNTESRVWMKNYFLKKLVRPLIPKLSKVATIESRSAIGQIYSKTISKTVSLVYPNLSFRSFDSEIEAYKWFTEYKDESAVYETVEISEDNLEQRRSNLIDNLYQFFFSWR